ncbi:aldehyde dehydrogenase family protein, partial [Paenibacillus massiliensis]|uniref:aldehyde dehydrogenase family protein n=1 Tax=Paenibacillus massiliensis TaxID=225917 RepID=UPI0004710D65
MIPYRPEPFTDFTLSAQHMALEEAVRLARTDIGQVYPLIVGGRRIETETFDSLNPSRSAEIVGRVSKADAGLAEEALQHAAVVFESWSRVSVEQRARLLLKAAAALRRRKHEFTAWLMLEAGKPRAEADADTAEA